MKPRKRRACGATIDRRRAHARFAVEECDDHRRPAGDPLQDDAGAIGDRSWDGEALRRDMSHKAEKKRQVGLLNPFLEQRQYEAALLRMQDIVGVLDPFSHPFVRDQRAYGVAVKQRLKGLAIDMRVDRHALTRRA